MSSRKGKTKTVAIETPPAPYDPVAWQQARSDIRELVDAPLRAWTHLNPNVRTPDAYLPLLTMPFDLAAAGWRVTVSESDAGWSLEIRREVQPGRSVVAAAQARSWRACLTQLIDSVMSTIDRTERRARKASESLPESEEAA